MQLIKQGLLSLVLLYSASSYAIFSFGKDANCANCSDIKICPVSPPCISYYCEPSCPPNQSCNGNNLTDGENGEGGACTGSDCGQSSSCPAVENSASTTSGAQNTSTGNPINLISGNKYKRQVDLEPLPGVLGLEFVRHYNSAISRSFGLGAGWRHSYSTILAVHKGFNPGEMPFLKLQQADGRIIEFTRVEQTKGKNTPTQYQTRNHSDGFITTTDYSYEWHWRSGRIIHFDDRGLMSQIQQGQQFLRLGYDASGRLMTIVDPQKRRLAFHYKGRYLAGFTDPQGNPTQFKYDKLERLTLVIRPTKKSRRYHYQDNERSWLLTGITDERGVRAQSYSYDDQGRATESTKDLNTEKVAVQYDNENNQRIVTDSQGNKTIYVLGKVNKQTIIQEVRGPGCSACEQGDVAYEYNDQLQVTKLTYKNGNTKQYVYDKLGRTTAHYQSTREEASQDKRRLIARYQYKDDSEQPSVIQRPSIKANSFVSTYIDYNADQQITRIKETGYAPATPLNSKDFNSVNTNTPLAYVKVERQSQLSYDNNGNLIEIDGPRKDVQDSLLISYNEYSQIEKITSPDGQTQTILAYDKSGRATQVQQGQQTPVVISYNKHGKPSQVGNGLQHVSYQYNGVGKLTQVTDPNGQTTTLAYDDANRLHKISRDNGPSLEVALDSEGRTTQKRITNANGDVLNTISYLYDAQKRLSTVSQDARNGDGKNTQNYHYNEQGELSKVSEQFGNDTPQETTVGRSVLGQLLQVSQADNVSTLLHLNQQGDTTGLTDARGNSTLQNKDDFGQTVQLVSADTGTTYYHYDNAGNITKKQTASGSITQRHYDAANRLLKQISKDGQTQYQYDPITARLIKLQNPSSTEQFSYDTQARLISHTRIIDQHSFTTLYAYNELSQLSEKTLPDGQTLYYHYYQDGKNKGQLQAINKNAWWGLTKTQLISELDDNHWDGQTRVRYGNGLLTTIDYDKRGNLSRINTSDSLALAYQYDAKGNITGIDYSNQQSNKQNNQKSSYTYDLFNRLNKAQINDTQYQYSYDKVGNRTQKTQGTKKQTLSYATKGNRLTQINKQPLKYNAEGSPLTSPSDKGQRSYTYNTQQRPIELYINGKLKAKYAYNGFGERIKKTMFNEQTQTTTYYLYDGRSLSAEANQQGEVTAQYLYHQNKPAIKLEKSNVYYIHSDHLGTPRTVTDEDQNTVWQANYSPFGQAQIHTQEISLNLRFPGQYEDQESGTYYNYFRDYNPEIGRYQTSDPIGLLGGINTYAYVSGNPLGYYDPLGLDTVVAINGPILSNPFGHTALGFTGSGVYSFGTVHSDGSSFSQYVLDAAKNRDSTYYIIDTNAGQERNMVDFYNDFKSRQSYDKISHNCATVTGETLGAGDIGDYWNDFVNNRDKFVPATIINMIIRRPSDIGVQQISVPKGATTVPPELIQFDPRG